MLTVLIHGFWGGPADWNGVLKELPLGADVWTPDLYEPGPLAPHHTLKDWTAHFIEEARDRAGSEPIQAVGYSMGGRMLTAALLAEPKIFRRALVLSANPIWADEGRNEWEMNWRERFLRDPWEELERGWNEMGIFTGSHSLNRRNTPVLREMLGQSLINWSPTKHPYSAEDVKSLPKAVEWAFGALDQKYLRVAKDLAKLPVQGQISIIENAGHRLPLDASRWVAAWLTKE
jgi:2-succinyl-6-hydroxy-2,4-cyclohexadiene-1-carboxylate synthase